MKQCEHLFVPGSNSSKIVLFPLPLNSSNVRRFYVKMRRFDWLRHCHVMPPKNGLLKCIESALFWESGFRAKIFQTLIF